MPGEPDPAEAIEEEGPPAPDDLQAAAWSTRRAAAYQNSVPGPPLNGPIRSSVIHPP